MKKNILALMIIIVLAMGLLIRGSATARDRFDFSSVLSEARNGDIEAMCDLGEAYYSGRQTLKDPFKAKCWIEKAYHKGSKRAQKIWNDFELWTYSGRCDASFDDTPLPEYSKGKTYVEPLTGIKFAYIPKGCFSMGCYPGAIKCKKDEKPVHKVCMDGFWMGKFEVTQGQWKQVMGYNPAYFSGSSGFPEYLTRPVENVSYTDIQIFIKRVNSQIAGKVLLPTEAQWEYACRSAGEETNSPWDADLSGPQANCGTCNPGELPEELRGQTIPVGYFAPNDLGVYDMAGNVKEWCRDYYDKKAYSEHKKNNPVYLKKESSRVVRGGSFNDNLIKLRCTARGKSLPGIKDGRTGFRLVLKREK
ncbi:MAG: SUMF1/EgtB/PvdO family nonheme iron enzyme [Desulfobacula sp.]|nr:SUMF1/EgtB/PvdO family nonheme iron enzyme [Desulfobacula sp.]